nr:hypothetical protein Iba_chr07cCG0720 [Ipomoea batatas]
MAIEMKKSRIGCFNIIVGCILGEDESNLTLGAELRFGSGRFHSFPNRALVCILPCAAVHPDSNPFPPLPAFNSFHLVNPWRSFHVPNNVIKLKVSFL